MKNHRNWINNAVTLRNGLALQTPMLIATEARQFAGIAQLCKASYRIVCERLVRTIREMFCSAG